MTALRSAGSTQFTMQVVPGQEAPKRMQRARRV